jgi:hypothetical protein
MQIRLDDLHGEQTIALLQEHFSAMRGVSPAESCHVLDLAGLNDDKSAARPSDGSRSGADGFFSGFRVK